MNIEKLRSYRILGIAAFDLILSIIGMMIAFALAWYFHFRELDLWKFLLAAVLLTIPFGIVIHVIFGSNTALNKRLGLSK